MPSKQRIYVPDRGDLVWLTLNPQVGHEQSGERPAIVLSTREFAAAVGYAVVCPITKTIRHSPFEVILKSGPVSGAILCAQVKSVDYRARKMRLAGEAPAEALVDVVAKISAIIGTEL